MDSKKTLITAGIVGVGGVALAYLGHSYLVEKEDKTEMDKAANTVSSRGGFMNFLWGSDDDEKNPESEEEMQTVKENLKIGISGVATDEEEEGIAIKKNVKNTISAFSGFFRSSEEEKNNNTKNDEQ